MTDVQKQTNNNYLPEVAAKDLSVIFCGLAASKRAVEIGHYYASPRNLFWPTLLKAKFVNKLITPSSNQRQIAKNYEDLIKHGIGLTDFIIDQSGNDSELKFIQTSIKQSRYRLMLFIIRYQPKYLAFNGKKAAKLYLGIDKIDYGLQAGNHDIGNTKLFVLPSTSAAAAGWWSKYEYHWRDLAKLIK